MPSLRVSPPHVVTAVQRDCERSALTRDKKNIVLRTFGGWSVGDPLTFLQPIG